MAEVKDLKVPKSFRAKNVNVLLGRVKARAKLPPGASKIEMDSAELQSDFDSKGDPLLDMMLEGSGGASMAEMQKKQIQLVNIMIRVADCTLERSRAMLAETSG
jgi:hypothetical protein